MAVSLLPRMISEPPCRVDVVFELTSDRIRVLNDARIRMHGAFQEQSNDKNSFPRKRVTHHNNHIINGKKPMLCGHEKTADFGSKDELCLNIERLALALSLLLADTTFPSRKRTKGQLSQ